MTTSPASSAFWLGVLLRQFPELNRELAPSRTARPATDRTPRSGLPPSAPIRLFVSDTIRDITDGVVELEEAVCDRLRLPRPPRGTVEQRLLRLLALADRGITADPLLADHVRAEARRMARRCALALGDAETPVRVRGRCPHCDSVSLRVFPHRETVLCINPGCRCATPSCACTTDDRHRHAWPRDQWQQLTEKITADLAELTAAQDDEEGSAR
ncbi:hypothetical protein ACWD4B_13610 [Streptomyces sp. NPDC002536]